MRAGITSRIRRNAGDYLSRVVIRGRVQRITAAGILCPGWSWAGLCVLVTISTLAVCRPIRAGLIAVSLAVIANSLYPGNPPPPESWEGVHTAFDRITDPV